MLRRLAAAILIIFVTGWVNGAGAQGHAGRGLAGVVQGPDGARLPGVVISIAEGDHVVAQVVSGDQGLYRASGLAPGRYRVHAHLQGFRAADAEVEVTSEAVARLDIRLVLETLTESVTVVGSAARETIEPARIRESGARDVGEAMAGMAGVWKVRRGAIASDVVVRGYQGDNVTVLIDGARLYGACPNNMDHTAFHVDFAEVERVEIGKGPFDLRNQGGLGAAVNIITKRPPEGAHFSAQLSAGSFGYLNPTVTGSYGTRRVAVLGGYSYRIADAYRDGAGRSFLQSANYRPGLSDSRAFEVNTGWTRVDAAPGANHALQAGYTRQRAGVVLYPYLQMDAVYDNADRVKLGYDLKRPIGPIEALHAQGYVTRVEHWMTDERRSSSVGMPGAFSMATRARTSTQGGKAEAVVRGGVVGVEIYRRGWDAETRLAMAKYQPQYSIPDADLVSGGLYGEFSRDLAGGLKLDFGGRLDRSRSAADAVKANTALFRAYHGAAATAATDTYPSGKLRLSWKVLPSLTMTAGVGRTVRVPDPQERYFGLRRAGTDWVGNPFLRPTRNTGVEWSAAYRLGRLYVNGNVHRDALRDAVGVYQQARVRTVTGITNASARSYRNLDATMSGAEIEAMLSVTDRLFLAGDVSVVRGRQHVDPASGVRSPWMAEMPPARTRLALRYDRRGQRHGLFGELEGVYSARQTHVDSDLKESPTPGYGVVNARVGGTLSRLRVAVGISNLFNRAYVEHLSYQRDPFRLGNRVYEAGRNVYTNVGLSF